MGRSLLPSAMDPTSRPLVPVWSCSSRLMDKTALDISNCQGQREPIPPPPLPTNPPSRPVPSQKAVPPSNPQVRQNPELLRASHLPTSHALSSEHRHLLPFVHFTTTTLVLPTNLSPGQQPPSCTLIASPNPVPTPRPACCAVLSHGLRVHLITQPPRIRPCRPLCPHLPVPAAPKAKPIVP